MGPGGDATGMAVAMLAMTGIAVIAGTGIEPAGMMATIIGIMGIMGAT
jgi:hypothetical protein